MHPEHTARVAGRLLAAALLLGGALGCRAPDIQAGRTNVLLIVIDTLRADHLGAWGYPEETSPQLDRLAREGVRFSQFYSNAPWTRPAMASLITGQYPRSTGVYEEQYDVLPDDLATLAERLQPRGYVTLGVTANPNINAWFGFAQGFTAYGDSSVVWPWLVGKVEGQSISDHPLEGAARITDRALQAIDRYVGDAGAAPFYLQMLYIDPHRPYSPPPEHLRPFGGPHRRYDAEIHYVDAEIGRLLRELDARGLLDDTLVIVTADHGEGLDSHPRVPYARKHGDHLYDSVLHVPLILRHPALPSRTVDAPASSIDLAPTLLDLLGIPVAEGEFAGRSLRPLLAGAGETPPDWPRVVISETDWREARRASVRSPRFRYVRNDDCRAFQREGIHEGRTLAPGRRRFLELPQQELYRTDDDRSEDPYERNLIESHPIEADELAGLLEAWEAETVARPPERRSPDDVFTLPDGSVIPAAPSGFDGEIDEELARQLRALGYVTGPES